MYTKAFLQRTTQRELILKQLNEKVRKEQFVIGVTNSKTMTYNSIRCGGGHHHGHEEDHYYESKSKNTKFQIPTQQDIDYQLPK